MLTKQNARRAAWLVGIAAIALVLCSKSSPLYVLNDWMDANIFFTMGKSMFRGKVLYRDVFDHKGPVLYFLYGLASLIDYTGFTGVLAVEIIAFALFLHCGLRTAELLAGRALHPAWAMLPAAGIAASRAFAHGGSAEELLLPFLAFALYGAVKTLQDTHPMPLRTVALHGFLAGCALWLKYTVLGFYLAWAMVLAVVYLWRGRAAQLGKSVAAYLGGMALATLPWVIYFGVNSALGDWFTCYFYDNLFLYKGEGGGTLALAQHLWWAVRDALPAAVLLAMFLIWAAAARKPSAVAAVAALAAGLALTSSTTALCWPCSRRWASCRWRRFGARAEIAAFCGWQRGRPGALPSAPTAPCGSVMPIRCPRLALLRKSTVHRCSTTARWTAAFTRRRGCFRPASISA